MQARGKEVNIMQKICEKMMTDEETDGEDGHSVLLKRVPPWHSKMLTKLMRTLDSRRMPSRTLYPRKSRKWVPSQTGALPKDVPRWALQDPASSHSCSDASSSPGAVSRMTPGQSPVHSPLSLLNQTSTPIQTHVSQMRPTTPCLPPRSLPTPSIGTRLSHHFKVMKMPAIPQLINPALSQMTRAQMTKLRVGSGQ